MSNRETLEHTIRVLLGVGWVRRKTAVEIHYGVASRLNPDIPFREVLDVLTVMVAEGGIEVIHDDDDGWQTYCLPDPTTTIAQSPAAKERAAVIAYLRSRSEAYRLAADEIAQGYHHQNRKP
jgi:hypothetical protein